MITAVVPVREVLEQQWVPSESVVVDWLPSQDIMAPFAKLELLTSTKNLFPTIQAAQSIEARCYLRNLAVERALTRFHSRIGSLDKISRTNESPLDHEQQVQSIITWKLTLR